MRLHTDHGAALLTLTDLHLKSEGVLELLVKLVLLLLGGWVNEGLFEMRGSIYLLLSLVLKGGSFAL